jgi:hypothetical protein
MEAEMHKYIMAFVTMFLFITAPYPAYGEEPAPSETTEEVKSDEVAPIPVEKVEEVEGAKEAKDEAKPEAEEKAEEKLVATEAIPENDVEAIQDAVAIWKALNSQDWSLAAGLIVMLLVYIFNRFGLKEKVGKKAIPFVSLAIGILSAVGIALASGGSLAVALEAGVLAGLAAVGSWEVLFKKILGDSSEDA